MMNFLKKLIIVCMSGFISLPINSFSAVIPLTDCKQLKEPHTLLVVHASWCPVCQRFMPEYEAIANDPAYKKWTFYEQIDDNWTPVCNVEIAEVPRVFVNHMQSLSGGDSVQVLKDYLNSH